LTSWQFEYSLVVLGCIYLPGVSERYIRCIAGRREPAFQLGPNFFHFCSRSVSPICSCSLACRKPFDFAACGICLHFALLAFSSINSVRRHGRHPHLVANRANHCPPELPLTGIGISFFVFHNSSLWSTLLSRKSPSPSDVFLYISVLPSTGLRANYAPPGLFMPRSGPKFLRRAVR